jgi:uncharacterized protein (TIGR02594 family)
MNYSTLNVQAKLTELGYHPGPLDGVRGRATINATKQFQRDHGLEMDGLVGPKTLAMLFGRDAYDKQQIAGMPVTVSPDRTPWMDIAAQIMGAHEARDNSRLRRWLRLDGGTVGDPAKIPWCGDYVVTALAQALPDEVFPANPYWARNWAKFGIPSGPYYGAIAVFERGSGGHVAFVIKRDPVKKLLYIRGGNQRNSVSDVWKSERELIAMRWPSTALPPAIQMTGTGGGRLSTNEA